MRIEQFPDMHKPESEMRHSQTYIRQGFVIAKSLSCCAVDI